MDFRRFLKERLSANRPLYLDGGMGTMIQAMGVTGFRVPEEIVFERPDILESIHARYAAAGSDIITTSTFGANPLKLARAGLGTDAVYAAAAACARRATSKCGRPLFIAGDIGPVGQLLEPLGKLTFDAAYDAFKASALAAERAGVDLILIETMTDLYEMKAAVLAAKENTSLPVFASMAYEENRRTLTGSDPLAVATTLAALRVDALGFNCGGSLEDALALSRAYCAATNLPILTEPNAGLPVVEQGRTVFKVTPAAFAACQAANAIAGVRILGGCCGTTPQHIAAMVAAIPEALPPRPAPAPATRVCSARRTVEIGNLPSGAGPKIIGERINPTGKKKCRAALETGDTAFILNEAESQINAGADILDVNVGVPGIDEAATMLTVLRALQRTFDTPLQIDSGTPAVLERALRYYNGKPLVNSVNGKRAVMDAVFPLVKRYGGSLVALCLDENGIPPTAEGRVAIARKILAEASAYGIPPQDILIDTLTLTISSQQKEALATLRALSLAKASLPGTKTILGVSNISFGLPRREIINAHFLAIALYAGLDACIINPLSPEMAAAFRAYRAIAAFDSDCLSYIRAYSPPADTENNYQCRMGENPHTPLQAGQGAATPSSIGNPSLLIGNSLPSPLQQAITKGFPDDAAAETRRLLAAGVPPDRIISDHIVPALDTVGKDFEAGRKFLPQLLLSAQTASQAFDAIKASLPSSGSSRRPLGTILMATVQGDIHDIGKNIVAAMLQNYGYTVVDLGKDVSPEDIVSRAIRDRIPLVGLSALMTTTVPAMQRTISQLRAASQAARLPIKIAVGGAVLTQDYADRIGADFYAKDAMAMVAIARRVFPSPPSP